jgi:predicted nucleotidyltransferase component of viral defense system
MSLEEVLAEKIRAILRRSAARDVYDIWFLIERLGVRVDVDAVKAKLSFYGSTLLPSQIIEKVETRAEHWEAELRPLIFGELPTFNQVVQALKKSLGVSRDV